MKATVWLSVLWFGLSLSAAEYTSYLPHFTAVSGKWQTVLSLTNPTSTNAPVTLRAWSPAGVLLAEHQLVVPPTEGIQLTADQIVDTTLNDRGWLSIVTDRENVSGIMLFRDLTTGGESSLALTRETGRNLLLPLLENKSGRASGVVVTNVSDNPAALTLTLTSLDGDYKNEVSMNLEPKAKTVAMSADLFGAGVPSAGYLSVRADNDIAGFALTFLNGTDQVVAVPGTLWDPGRQPELQEGIEAYFGPFNKSGAVLGVRVAEEEPPVLAAMGYAKVETERAMKPGSIADIGSITKTFVAALILLHQEEGRLNINDTLADYMPDFPKSGQITLRMMLNHTSGIYNYTNNEAFLQEAFFSGSPVVYTPEQLLQYAVNEPFVFEPGAGWSYSNTNYVLLGRIIEMVGGSSFRDQLHQRLFGPLGMKDTYLAGDEPVPGRADRYFHDATGAGLVNLTESNDMSWAWAAGAIASTVEDLKIWGDALYGGKLLNADSMAAMFETVPTVGNSRYGLGMAVFQVNGRTLVGHDGATLGGVAFLGYFVDDGTIIATVVNFQDANVDLDSILVPGLRFAGVINKHQQPQLPKLFQHEPGFRQGRGSR